jgi:DNA-binding transcriptional regulator of glucitol operon
MRKLETMEMVNYRGGGFQWRSFASGFCDVLAVGSAITGNFVGAMTLLNISGWLGIGSKLYDNL